MEALVRNMRLAAKRCEKMDKVTSSDWYAAQMIAFNGCAHYLEQFLERRTNERRHTTHRSAKRA